ncbi:hypothetical protein [Actinocorallia populi]|uniref:hypothetical protein n=1 Tax=Actinocorallia populi TaxID=2079200 RepID=UPI000D09496F|nr:hypothetical protein [Actinocorallia populi]
MRRFTTAAALSVALVAGLVSTSSPAAAAPETASRTVEDTVVRQGTIPGAELLAQAERDGTPYSAKKARALKKAPCRWFERQQGLRVVKSNGKKGRWLIWVKLRLNWCYDGYQVLSANAKYRSYTYDRATYRWRGWGQKHLKRTGSSVTSRVKGKFYHTRSGRTYKPWITSKGYSDGAYRWWSNI